MLLVGGYQAMITAYLSFKIYTTSRGSSELPDLKVEIDYVDEASLSMEKRTILLVTLRVYNNSYGAANIYDMEVSTEKTWMGEQLNIDFEDKIEGGVFSRFIEDKDTPITLKRGGEFKINIIVCGSSDFAKTVIVLHESQLGELKYNFTMFELHNSLRILRESKKQSIDIGQ